ncbi:hypothetical protein MASR1M45_16090 [Candidatus Kapaibacterium sp.]
MKKEIEIYSKIIIISMLLLLVIPLGSKLFANGIFINNNTTVNISPNTIVKINGSLNVSGGASFTQNGNIFITGNWINNGNQTSSSGIVTFIGSESSFINSLSATSTQFYQIILSKDNINDTLVIDVNTFNAINGF